MRVMVVGGGGREHALVWKLSHSRRVSALQCAPGNAGIARLATCVDVPLRPPFKELIAHVARERIDLVVVGPEAPLVAGAADALLAAGVPCFGAVREAAQLEGSKAFTRTLMREAGVPSHAWEVFDDARAAQGFYRRASTPWWIKADGLAAGKGAVLPASIDAGCALLAQWLSDGAMGEAGRRVVIEEPLTGPEASIIAFVDGETVRCLAPSQDHKRLLDGDEGPNTGGMGALAPVPTVEPAMISEVEEKILRPTLRALHARGIEFRGVLYAGLMLTSEGPRLLEYNVRLGDPEAQVILPLMENDLLEVIEATLDGHLHEVALQTKPGAAINVVAAAEGYPASPRRGDVIENIPEAEALLGDDGIVFHAGTKLEEGKLVTSGGRVLGVTALGPDLESCRGLAYAALERIHWPGMHFRRDIAKR
jgi:phosphoribosylamine--glycine ligase